MSNPTPVTYSSDAEGIGWLTFDDPAGRANVFNPTTLAAFRDAIADLAGRLPKAVVIHSAKEKTFIVGADLKWLVNVDDAASATRLSREGQELFGRLADLKVPVVCAIHGACAGGGYEMALACHWRLASDAKETVIGLPEVGIGLIPGWGGCARLPRLIGAEAALGHILKAALVPAAAAIKSGLIDELVPAAEFKARARAAALRLAAEGAPKRPAAPAPAADFFATQRKAVSVGSPGTELEFAL